LFNSRSKAQLINPPVRLHRVKARERVHGPPNNFGDRSCWEGEVLMRTALLIAGSALALAIAAPAFAQTGALNGVTGGLPNAGSVAPVKSLPATPVSKPRVGHSNRPSVKVKAPVARSPIGNGKTIAQVRAPRHPGDSRVVRVKSSNTRSLVGSGTAAGVKRNGVQAVALGHGQGLNTKKTGLPLTAANGPANTLSGAGHGALVTASKAPGGGALGTGANGHGNLGANVGRNPNLVTNPGAGRKH
jgi:hypothetical protein